jgi:SAM-dependent methyltransferase
MNDPHDVAGTPATREFYDKEGWTRDDANRLVDQSLFGVREDGPIRRQLHLLGNDRIRQALGGPGLRLLECGCGGTPATFLADRCAYFTAVDFSATGLAEAAKSLATTGIRFATVAADMCRLPFPDGHFDAAYCAQAIYHIDDPAGQAAAFDQIMRVVKPGGVAVFVMVNPFPLLFPVRAARRVLAATPLVAGALNRIRNEPPLPFRPMRLGWMRGQLAKWGAVEIFGYRIASTWFNQHVPETGGVGRMLWRTFARIETTHPRAAARLGCYVSIVARKR